MLHEVKRVIAKERHRTCSSLGTATPLSPSLTLGAVWGLPLGGPRYISV